MQVVLNPWQVALGIVIGVAGASWAGPQPARAAGAAVVYEHRVEDVGAKQEFQNDLNRWAAEGWEAGPVYQGYSGKNVVLRRPK